MEIRLVSFISFTGFSGRDTAAALADYCGHVKARPQHQELCALHFTNSVWVLYCPTVICDKGCETGPPVYSPYPRREDLKV